MADTEPEGQKRNIIITYEVLADFRAKQERTLALLEGMKSDQVKTEQDVKELDEKVRHLELNTKSTATLDREYDALSRRIRLLEDNSSTQKGEKQGISNTVAILWAAGLAFAANIVPLINLLRNVAAGVNH